MEAMQWGQIKEIYDRALDLSDEDRKGFLAEACGDDDGLRREVELLLAAHDDAGAFLQVARPRYVEVLFLGGLSLEKPTPR